MNVGERVLEAEFYQTGSSEFRKDPYDDAEQHPPDGHAILHSFEWNHH